MTITAVALSVLALIPASLQPQHRPPACPRGLHSVTDYREYAQVAYNRTSIGALAQRKLAYLMKCQHSYPARRLVARYHQRFKRERAMRETVQPLRAVLRRIAMCESGGNPRAISPGGDYRGKFQFDLSTWNSVGGRGDPAAAPEVEQDERAAILYRSAGPERWPVCGR